MAGALTLESIFKPQAEALGRKGFYPDPSLLISEQTAFLPGLYEAQAEQQRIEEEKDWQERQLRVQEREAKTRRNIALGSAAAQALFFPPVYEHFTAPMGRGIWDTIRNVPSLFTGGAPDAGLSAPGLEAGPAAIPVPTVSSTTPSTTSPEVSPTGAIGIGSTGYGISRRLGANPEWGIGWGTSAGGVYGLLSAGVGGILVGSGWGLVGALIADAMTGGTEGADITEKIFKPVGDFLSEHTRFTPVRTPAIKILPDEEKGEGEGAEPTLYVSSTGKKYNILGQRIE